MKSAGVRSDLKNEGKSICFFLSGEIDHHSAKYLKERIDAEIYFFHPKKVILELSDVSFMDSAGLGLILGRYTKAHDFGADYEVCNPTDEILRIIKMSGADKLFSIKYENKENSENKERNKKEVEKEVI